jgi:hypothetical protein
MRRQADVAIDGVRDSAENSAIEVVDTARGPAR